MTLNPPKTKSIARPAEFTEKEQNEVICDWHSDHPLLHYNHANSKNRGTTNSTARRPLPTDAAAHIHRKKYKMQTSKRERQLWNHETSMVSAVRAVHQQLKTNREWHPAYRGAMTSPCPHFERQLNDEKRNLLLLPKRQREQIFIVNSAPDLRFCVHCLTNMRSHVCFSPPTYKTRRLRTNKMRSWRSRCPPSNFKREAVKGCDMPTWSHLTISIAAPGLRTNCECFSAWFWVSN